MTRSNNLWQPADLPDDWYIYDKDRFLGLVEYSLFGIDDPGWPVFHFLFLQPDR